MMKLSDLQAVQNKLAYRQELLRRLHAVSGPLVHRLNVVNPDEADDKSMIAEDIRKETALDDEAQAFRKIQAALHELYRSRLDRLDADLAVLGVEVD